MIYTKNTTDFNQEAIDQLQSINPDIEINLVLESLQNCLMNQYTAAYYIVLLKNFNNPELSRCQNEFSQQNIQIIDQFDQNYRTPD